MSDGAPRVLHRAVVAVRWRDLDAYEHVNNAAYLTYLEEARLQWFDALPGPWMDDVSAPVIAASQLQYRRSILWPAQVAVELFAERVGNSSLTLGHRIVAADDASVLYCDGHVVAVWIERASGQSTPLPAAVRAACA